MNVAVGADHAGFALKQHIAKVLADWGHQVIDFAFVCDQDSEDEPSPLLSATMPAAEGLE